MTNPPVSIALAFLTNLSYIVFLKTSISTTSLIFFLNQQDHVLTYQHLIYLFYRLNCLNHLVHFLIYQYLRGMLHVGEVKFNLGWVFFEIHVPFILVWNLKTSTPGWNGYFDLSAWYFECFHFMKIQIFWQVTTDKISMI